MYNNGVYDGSMRKRTGWIWAALPEIGVGMIGYGFMGKAHTAAYQRFPALFWPPGALKSPVRHRPT